MSQNLDRGVVFTFGRFNPPHSGHVKLVKFVTQTAIKLNADAVVFGSQSQDPQKNPLPHSLKMNMLQQLVGKSATHFETNPSVKTPWDAVLYLMTLGYTRIYLVAAGDDRVPGFISMFEKLQRTPEGSKLTALEVVSSDVPGSVRVKGISGTAARNAAVSGDLDGFITIVGPQNAPAAERIYHDLRRFMSIRESSTVEWIVRRWHRRNLL